MSLSNKCILIVGVLFKKIERLLEYWSIQSNTYHKISLCTSIKKKEIYSSNSAINTIISV